MQKNLVISKKSSNFARFFAKKQHVWPLAIEIEGLRISGYRLRTLSNSSKCPS